MRWVVEPDPAAYAERVLPWLGRDPVLTTVPATILVGALQRGDDTAWRAWLADGAGEVAGVALRTPGHGLVLTALPPGAAELLAGIAEPLLPGAAGPAADVEAVATAYAQRHGARAVPGIRQRLFRLGRLAPPPPPGGRLRAATDADVELGARWFDDFCAEAGLRPDPGRLATSRRVVAQGRLDFWAVGGVPVCMVGHSLTVAGVTRIGPVWTPPEHRRRGYAAAATAAVAGRLARHGAVVLFADRANPTATGVYERVGFRPVADWDDWELEC
jgi:RimJ/RimL family protein N-acetyltransferase